MTVSLIEESEIPEYFSCPCAVKGFKTADTGQITLWAAGHHPKMRIVRFGCFLGASAVTSVLVIEDGDGTDATGGLSPGTTAFVTTEGSLIAGQYFDRNEAVCLTPTTAGTTTLALVFVQCESIH